MPDKPKVWNKRDKNCPKDAVYVGRPSKWGNPFKMKHESERAEVIRAYRVWLLGRLNVQPGFLDELKGKDLVCWCAPLHCHADVLLELANNVIPISPVKEEK